VTIYMLFLATSPLLCLGSSSYSYDVFMLQVLVK
jgi:hypothetical protein